MTLEQTFNTVASAITPDMYEKIYLYTLGGAGCAVVGMVFAPLLLATVGFFAGASQLVATGDAPDINEFFNPKTIVTSMLLGGIAGAIFGLGAANNKIKVEEDRAKAAASYTQTYSKTDMETFKGNAFLQNLSWKNTPTLP